MFLCVLVCVEVCYCMLVCDDVGLGVLMCVYVC